MIRKSTKAAHCEDCDRIIRHFNKSGQCRTCYKKSYDFKFRAK